MLCRRAHHEAGVQGLLLPLLLLLLLSGQQGSQRGACACLRGRRHGRQDAGPRELCGGCTPCTCMQSLC